MSITIKQGLSGRYLSRNIPDLEVGCTGDRLGVKIAVDATEVFSETLFPVDGLVELADLGDLLTPYARKSLVAFVEVTLTEGDASASLTTQKQTFEVVYCEADVPTGCEDFTKNHFLSLLLGVKITGMGRLEYLHYAGTEEASVTARYDDGTEKTFELDPVGGNGRYTTIEVSPAHFAKEGAELMEYTVKAGGRFQEYEVDSRRTDCAPVLLFVNSFGVDELIYCTGTATKAPSFKRESAYIRGINRNYAITETRTFKADTGILTEDMADWFGEVLRSGCVRIVTFSNGKPNVGKEVVITESKSEQSNDPDELTRFTFSYQYAQRNHNVVEMEREGRVFDNTFDNTFN